MFKKASKQNKERTMSEGKVVLITGCGKGGIGYEYCKAFAELNCSVFASDVPRRMPDLAGLRSEPRIETLELDVTSDASVAAAVDRVISRAGRIDVLVNNAGVGSTGPLAELPLEAARRAYEVNALGQLRVAQRVVPHMAACGVGSIVNVGSVVGEVPTPWAGSYCATKAYVHAMSHALRVELRPFGISVVLVQPGAVRSSFGSNNMDLLKDYDWRMYRDFKDSICERARASQSGKSTDAAVFASHVARKVLSSNPPKVIRYGHMTKLFAVLSLSPLWVRDLCFRKIFQL